MLKVYCFYKFNEMYIPKDLTRRPESKNADKMSALRGGVAMLANNYYTRGVTVCQAKNTHSPRSSPAVYFASCHYRAMSQRTWVRARGTY
jgi:hypothetical protein